MRRRGCNAWLGLLALAALPGCVAERSRPQVQYTAEPWSFGKAAGQKLTTTHYEILTTLQERALLEALPGFVEASFAHYADLAAPAHLPAERMKIYLFASRPQWEAFTKQLAGPRAKVLLQVRNGGYCERGIVVVEYVTHAVTFPLFAHEGWHQYVHHCLAGPIPAWLNEGLAVTCEGQRWNSYGIKEFDPWYNPLRRNNLSEALLSGRLYPLPALLETDAGKVVEGSSRSIGTYYAQLWALIVFLQEGAGGRYAPGLDRLLRTMSETELAPFARAAHIGSERTEFSFGVEVFRSFIDPDVAAVEREYLAFLRAKFLDVD